MTFGLVLLGRGIDFLPYFVLTFQELGAIGIGKGRHPYTLQEVRAVDSITGKEKTIYSHQERRILKGGLSVSTQKLLASAADKDPKEVSLSFLTMTRLKFEDRWARTIEFHILIRNLLRRVSSMAYFHHGLEWTEDFVTIINQAEQVRISQDKSRWAEWERYSSRQNQKVPLGGVIGEVTYTGFLKSFLPLLYLGSLIHVGKAATFGMGKYRVERVSV